MPHAAGTFDVKIKPQPLSEVAADSAFGRMSLDKQYHGDLEATGKGEMLSVMTAVKGSAVYVALERVTGQLHGRGGAFVLQHAGVMVRGEQRLSVTVVEDSGTGQLTGLTGKLDIKVEGGQHFYEFDYSLAES